MASPLRYTLRASMGLSSRAPGRLGPCSPQQPAQPAQPHPLARQHSTWARASRTRTRSRTQARWNSATTGVACLSLALSRLSMQPALQDDEDIQDLDDSLLQKVDRLSDWGQVDEAMEEAKRFKKSNNPELLWRWGRLCYLMSEHAAEARPAERPALVREGLAAVDQALQLDPSCGRAHQWKSVLRHAVAECNGTLHILNAAPKIRHDMERAAELMPRDCTIRTMLGMWYFTVAQLSWFERQVVSATGCRLPSDCLLEALNFFQAAERVQPGGSGSSLNLLMLGKTLLQLGRPDSARHFLEQAARAQAHNVDDHKAQLEARGLLLSWQD